MHRCASNALKIALVCPLFDIQIHYDLQEEKHTLLFGRNPSQRASVSKYYTFTNKIKGFQKKWLYLFPSVSNLSSKLSLFLLSHLSSEKGNKHISRNVTLHHKLRLNSGSKCLVMIFVP